MKRLCEIKKLSDQQLLNQLDLLNHNENKALVNTLMHLGVVDQRKLYATLAYSSLFDYVMSKYNYSEDMAYKRIGVCRAAMKYPLIWEMLEKSDLHLTGVRLLAPHLTSNNHKELLELSSRKSKREIEKIIAAHRPQPPIAESIRKLPSLKEHKSSEKNRTNKDALNSEHLGPHSNNLRNDIELLNLKVDSKNPPKFEIEEAKGRAAKASHRDSVKPLSRESYKIQFTINDKIHDKLKQVQDLLRHENPTGDLAMLFDKALDLLLEKKRKQKYGSVVKNATKSKKITMLKEGCHIDKTDRPIGHRSIAAETRRIVGERDAHCCSFVDERGRQCGSKAFLEFHHLKAYAKGGDNSAQNIVLFCKTHNNLAAVKNFGLKKMSSYSCS